MPDETWQVHNPFEGFVAGLELDRAVLMNKDREFRWYPPVPELPMDKEIGTAPSFVSMGSNASVDNFTCTGPAAVNDIEGCDGINGDDEISWESKLCDTNSSGIIEAVL